MGPRIQKTVGDLAFEHGVHEDMVLDFAEYHQVPTVGREFVFEPEEEREFETWLEERSSEDDEPGDAGDDADRSTNDDEDSADTGEDGDQ